MQTPYEILIRFSDAGKYQGGHYITRDSDTGRVSKAAPISDAQWPDVCATINEAAHVRVTELEQAADVAAKASVAALAEAAQQARLEVQGGLDHLVQAAEVAITAGDIDGIQAVLAKAKGLTSEARAQNTAKKRAELQAQIDALGQ